MLAINLLHHEVTAEARPESRVGHLWHHLRWQPALAERMVRSAERQGLVRRQQAQLTLTGAGRSLARQAMSR